MGGLAPGCAAPPRLSRRTYAAASSRPDRRRTPLIGAMLPSRTERKSSTVCAISIQHCPTAVASPVPSKNPLVVSGMLKSVWPSNQTLLISLPNTDLLGPSVNKRMRLRSIKNSSPSARLDAVGCPRQRLATVISDQEFRVRGHLQEVRSRITALGIAKTFLMYPPEPPSWACPP